MAKADTEKVCQVHFRVQLEHTILFLNQINEIDATVLPALIKHRVPCNLALANHPTVQVGETDKGHYEVGLLGILNGLFGVKTDSWGYIAAKYATDSTGKLEQIKHFEILEA